MKQYIALKTGKTSYKFINTDKIKEYGQALIALAIIYVFLVLLLSL